MSAQKPHVDDQYHLKLRLFTENDIVWADDDPDAPVEITREPPRFTSELDITLSRADLLSEESQNSRRLITEALSTMDISEKKHSLIIGSILTDFKETQSATAGDSGRTVDLAMNKTRKRRRAKTERPPYVCLTTKRYKLELAMARRHGLEINGTTSCAICTEEFESGGIDGLDDRIVHLPCTHLFHVKCIDKWLAADQYGLSCPLCRFPLRRRFHQLLFK